MWPLLRRKAKTVTPPVDLDTPVTNPALIAAMAGLATGTDQAAIDTLLHELNRAVYLVATILDQADITERSPGQVTFEKGSLIKVRFVTDSDDRPLLPLFTDWDAIRKWTSDPVSSLVMPANQAWDFALQQYQGVVINPGGPLLELNRDQLADLKRRGSSGPWYFRGLFRTDRRMVRGVPRTLQVSEP